MKLKLKWKIIFCIILFILLIFISLKLGNIGLKVREYKVINNKVSSFYGFKIVHFSDLYYGSINEKKLNKLVNMINNTKPDIVIFTGDLIKKDVKVDDSLIKLLTNYLSKIDSNFGKFYVNGENDTNVSSSILDNSNFKCLDDTYEIIYGKNNKKMFISGISIDKNLNNDISENLNLNEYDYKILLSHYPDKVDDILKYNFDLILSGHSLNGQIRLPAVGSIITPNNSKKYYDSYYKIDRTDLYISNGIGNKSINMRLFNTPSFNLYRLVDK